jgi:hypothetical protein
LMKVMSSPRGDAGSRMDEHFHEADDTGIVDFDPWDFGMARNDGSGQALKQREIHMDLEGLSLKGGETVGDG